MGLVVDCYYLLRELFKLVFMVMISPLGLAAGFLLAWN
jgi:hypothetical protein